MPCSQEEKAKRKGRQPTWFFQTQKLWFYGTSGTSFFYKGQKPHAPQGLVPFQAGGPALKENWDRL